MTCPDGGLSKNWRWQPDLVLWNGGTALGALTSFVEGKLPMANGISPWLRMVEPINLFSVLPHKLPERGNVQNR